MGDRAILITHLNSGWKNTLETRISFHEAKLCLPVLYLTIVEGFSEKFLGNTLFSHLSRTYTMGTVPPPPPQIFCNEQQDSRSVCMRLAYQMKLHIFKLPE